MPVLHMRIKVGDSFGEGDGIDSAIQHCRGVVELSCIQSPGEFPAPHGRKILAMIECGELRQPEIALQRNAISAVRAVGIC